MNFDQAKMAVINSIQFFLDDQELGLMVGEITDDDYKMLSRGFGDLEWPWALNSIGNEENCISFCFKITGGHIPDGIAMGLYELEEGRLSIHMMESFVREDLNHPLQGRMIYFTLVSAYLFLTAFEGNSLDFVDALNQDLEKKYQSYGFSAPYKVNNSMLQTISIDRLKASITEFSEND